jgi:hypothetical protein
VNAEIAFAIIKEHGAHQDIVTVLGENVALASDDPTGRVSGGFLRLQRPTSYSDKNGDTGFIKGDADFRLRQSGGHW